MSRLAENERSIFEELERIEVEISRRIKRNPEVYQSSGGNHNILGGKKRSLRETLLQQHECKLFLDQYSNQCRTLKRLMGSDQDMKNAKIDLNEFESAYDEIKQFHYKYPNNPVDDLSNIYSMFSSNVNTEEVEKRGNKKRRRVILSSFASNLSLQKIFSDEEFFGNYLDLIEFHEKWLNLPGNDARLSYIEYLDIFNKLPNPSNIDLKIEKKTKSYLNYVKDLAEYLKKFYIKIQPLLKPEVSIIRIEQDFEQKWNDVLKDEAERELNSIGKEIKFEKVQEDGIFCKICEKLFSKKTVFDGHLEGKKHKKNFAKLIAGNKVSTITIDEYKEILQKEHIIKEVSLLLAKKISNTRANVERKNFMTDRERFLEIESLRKIEEDELYESSSSSDDKKNGDSDSDDESFSANYSNPLKLPIGFDGRPIPFWLWKLHGLGLEFNCEICGNSKYQGRKNYVKHFTELKHLHGLKCLGIDPSLINVYKGISKIEDAIALNERLTSEHKKDEKFIENLVEVEDDEGNVMSQRDYEDLKKQGLI
ncbi:hypothetical protein PACTADRAFT_49571 [Pachysolen tannophilus NRRL Y-2460]|uniref:C2H2-type domain-containing protein n=1 Tax=Pachysolen tannophilus NRRL Y-2460 TaxID=669874 RepID=A0A1E4TWP2_PACTA|nr:hypothetical protein PACTADRAFT_49571 [Pachysolen tannophilus NRRL Y-2460]